MSNIIEIKTQAELDKSIEAGNSEFRFIAGGEFEIKTAGRWFKTYVAAELTWNVKIFAWGSSRVEARESSRVEARESSRVEARESSRVEARESSSVVAWGSSSVVAWGSSSVVAWGSSRVEARGSSSVVAWGSSSVVARESSRVEARESSSVVAWGSSRVEARGSSRVEAKGFVSVHAFGGTIKLGVKCHVHIHKKGLKITGGIKTMAIIKTASEWCENYGIEVKKGIAIVYKAVRNDFGSERAPNFKYTPGTMPVPDSFDKVECSHGIHASPSPKMAKYEFFNNAEKFVALPVKVSDMLIFPDGSYPSKVKFPKLAAPCYEVDIDGNRIDQKEAA